MPNLKNLFDELRQEGFWFWFFLALAIVILSLFICAMVHSRRTPEDYVKRMGLDR